MISGFDRYFQIVRCFRDEDLRADRQPEFTQIDLEMSYPQPERVWEVVEGFLTAAFKAAGHEIKTSFPRMDYDDAMRQYGIDKPDLRLPALTDVRDCFTPEDLEALGHQQRPARCSRFALRRSASFREKSAMTSSRSLSRKAERASSKTSSASRTSFPKRRKKFARKRAPRADDLLVLVVGSAQSAKSDADAHPASKRKVTPAEMAIYASAGMLRVALAQKYADRHGIFKKTGDPAKDYRFLWVTNFPMFEYDEGRQALDGGASSLHLAARRRHGQARKRPGHGARASLRRRAERHRTGLRLDPYSSARYSKPNLPRARHDRRRSQSRASDFSWKRWSTARLRMEASRWDWTAS